ncbi:MAG: hypothetical protein PHF56_20275 [Desulfuromonadaceae bacterium]|nr:hypothetical protein [Desulfuromonadaceae bacterium]
MARRDKKRGFLRPYVKGSWVPIEDDLILSNAFRGLQPSAAILLLHLHRIDKVLAWKEGDSYGGEFNMTFTEAETLGLSRGTTMRAVQDLASRGFIEIVVKGGLRSQGRTSSVYRIVEKWRTFAGLQTLKELKILKDCGKSS